MEQMQWTPTSLEPTRQELAMQAEELRIGSGFKLTYEQALDRICDSWGWVKAAHMEKCKTFRKAD